MRTIAITAILALSACGGVNTIFERYGGIRPVAFAHDGSTWRIYDKPEEYRLMITPSIADSMAAGAISGATLGIANDALGPDARYVAASNAWIKRHGASCEVTGGEVLAGPQHEYRYRC